MDALLVSTVFGLGLLVFDAWCVPARGRTVAWLRGGSAFARGRAGAGSLTSRQGGRSRRSQGARLVRPSRRCSCAPGRAG